MAFFVRFSSFKNHFIWISVSVPIMAFAYLFFGNSPEEIQAHVCWMPYVSYVLYICKAEEKNVNIHTAYKNETSILNSTEELNGYLQLETFLHCMVKNTEEEIQRSSGFHQHGFNIFASEKIGFLRNIPDTRNPVCKNKKYDPQHLTASIVMCFYNEGWSTLLRSVHSILRQTPQDILKEIILFDDHSDLAHLGQELDDYIVQNFNNVKLIRSEVRLGLIRAKMEAAKYATGQVLVFLDSHIEAGESWLEPLLDRIAKHRETVVMPIVDTIEPETMVYRGGGLMRSGFTWSLFHNWEPLPPDVERAVGISADPYISPTMPGGLFAMERDYFFELGAYDPGMDIWGGENMEISFRIWMCGGKLEIVPCSRVGHVFRKFRPYGSPTGEDTTTKNAARVAAVWLDEYKKHFFHLRPDAAKMDYGDVTERVELRKRLKCKSFKWFLEKIHPEQSVPGEKPKVSMQPKKKSIVTAAEGKIQHQPSGLCVSSESEPPSKTSALILSKCDEDNKSLNFILTKNHQIRLNNTRMCLETAGEKNGSSLLYLMKCHGGGGAQTWVQLDIDKLGHIFFNPASGKCLSVSEPNVNEALVMHFCMSEASQGFQVLQEK